MRDKSYEHIALWIRGHRCLFRHKRLRKNNPASKEKCSSFDYAACNRKQKILRTHKMRGSGRYPFLNAYEHQASNLNYLC